MPLYSDLIKTEDEYNYSVNIQFDMENDRKLLRFIPNETTIELLREYFVDITKDKSSHHARILYGSYGTGKSHFLTVLSLLLGKVFTKGLAYQTFIDRIKTYDENLANDIDSYVKSKDRKPMLVVPIVFDFDDFDRCIYFSLKKKLDSIGKNVSFKTFFDQATGLINTWKQNKESATRLAEASKKLKIDIDDLETSLSVFDKKAETKFKKLFSEMTYGVKYIYEVANISENISQANKEIADEYSGIVFIFDEFGRYIEDNMKSIKVKSVQDLAEFCDHGGENDHIILVSHKEISQYTQNVSKTLANEWKKVEGRYKATPINDRQDQCLSLIKNIIVKDDKVWSQFKDRYSKELDNMYAEASDFRGFLVDIEKDGNPFEGGFPLHPISLFTLDKLSKKVAQNERTFFTYLASHDDNSLFRFLHSYDIDEFHFVGIDKIYDYFEPSIKAVQSDSSFKWYKELQSALSKNHSSVGDDTPEVKILKVIATIGIINDASTLVADKATITKVIDCPHDVVENAIDGLCENKIIKYSGAYNRYDFYESSIFDVDEMIEKESQSVTDDAIVNILNEEFVNFALYPHVYNRAYKINRVFLPVFATTSDAQKSTLLNKFGKYYDGALIMLLCDKDFDDDQISEISLSHDRSIVLANTETQDLKNSVKQYIAVKYLYSQKAKYNSQDPAFEKELQYFRDELIVSISKFIENWKLNTDDSVKTFVNGECLKEADFTNLTQTASEIMFESYPNTLIVNNELINKNVISGSIMSAKKNVTAAMMRDESSKDYYGMSLLSPEYIAIRSVLVKNGFIKIDDVYENSLGDENRPQLFVKKVISEFISKSKVEPVSFETVYEKLKSKPFGLRDGYLSMLLVHAILPYRKSLIIDSHGVEQELSSDLFEEIVRRPVDYTLSIADWDKKQLDYLESLEQIFSDYINKMALSKNRLKAIYDGMLLHYKNTTKFARTTQQYADDDTKTYRKLLEKSSANYSTFLFTKLNVLGNDYNKTIDTIKAVKINLDDSVRLIVDDISNGITKIFKANNVVSIAELFSNQYENSWKAKRKKSFDYYTNSFLDFVSKIDPNESDYDLIIKLTKVLTGFELYYWNDSHKDEFLDKILEIKTKLDAYKEDAKLSDGETKMTLVTSSGNEKSVVFDNSELSSLSKTVKNKINATLKNYGMAISYDDKVQIMLSVLEDLMEGK